AGRPARPRHRGQGGVLPRGRPARVHGVRPPDRAQRLGPGRGPGGPPPSAGVALAPRPPPPRRARRPRGRGLSRRGAGRGRRALLEVRALPGVIGYIAVIVSAFAVTFASMPLLRALSFLVGALQHPDARRDHPRPTPILGGAGVGAGGLVGLLVAWLTGGFGGG